MKYFRLNELNGSRIQDKDDARARKTDAATALKLILDNNVEDGRDGGSFNKVRLRPTKLVRLNSSRTLVESLSRTRKPATLPKTSRVYCNITAKHALVRR